LSSYNKNDGRGYIRIPLAYKDTKMRTGDTSDKQRQRYQLGTPLILMHVRSIESLP
jgi:hypothetical protein